MEKKTTKFYEAQLKSENLKATAEYTGGGIWVYTGKVGECYFMGSDSNGNWVLLVDTDPDEVWDEAWYPEWQEKHGVAEFCDNSEAFNFYDRLYDYLEENDLCIDVKILREETNEYRRSIQSADNCN